MFKGQSQSTPPQPSPSLREREGDKRRLGQEDRHSTLVITAQARRAPALPVGWVL